MKITNKAVFTFGQDEIIKLVRREIYRKNNIDIGNQTGIEVKCFKNSQNTIEIKVTITSESEIEENK